MDISAQLTDRMEVNMRLIISVMELDQCGAAGIHTRYAIGETRMGGGVASTTGLR